MSTSELQILCDALEAENNELRSERDQALQKLDEVDGAKKEAEVLQDILEGLGYTDTTIRMALEHPDPARALLTYAGRR